MRAISRNRPLSVLVIGFCFASATFRRDDATTDLSDGVFILNGLFLEGLDAPPPGHRDCGVDPSPGDLSCEDLGACEL